MLSKQTRKRRNAARRRRANENWLANGGNWQPPRRRRKIVYHSILDLIFLPGFLIMDELVERLRRWLNVR